MGRTYEEIEKLAKEIADYIIETNCSTRDAAIHFNVSNYTVSDYLNNRIPKEDSRYKKVKEILNSHNQTVDKTVTQNRILKELELFQKGLTCSEIADSIGISASQVSRDLTERLKNIKNIDVEILKTVSDELKQNSINNLNKGNNNYDTQPKDEKGRFI